MSNRFVAITCLIALAIVAVGYGCRQLGKHVWEEFLWGPYRGEAFAGTIESAPVSSLALGNGVLDLYEIPETPNPILVCRLDSGEILSQTVLVPARTNDNSVVVTATVDVMRLVRRYRPLRITNAPVCVYIKCDWE